MGFFISLGIRLALTVAMWQAWGWLIALIAFASIFLIKTKKDSWGIVDYHSLMTWIRMVVEIAFLVAGLIAVDTVWGTIWTATLVVIYVIGLIVD